MLPLRGGVRMRVDLQCLAQRRPGLAAALRKVGKVDEYGRCTIKPKQWAEAAALHPLKPREWSMLVRLLVSAYAKTRQPEDRGVGDTLARQLGAGGEAFKAALKAMGIDCGCAARQEWANTMLPYPLPWEKLSTDEGGSRAKIAAE